ncbi:MAG: fasciclin domain-containing protein, partial [Flammeovirgaceae bacterium]
VILLMAFLWSCERENLTNEKVKVIAGIKADPQLTRLSAAIDRAGLAAALNGTQYTILAPTDSAFAAAGIDPNALDPATLLSVLQYHIIPSRIDSSRFGFEFGWVNQQLDNNTLGLFSPPINPQNTNFYGQLSFQGFQTMNLNLNANLYVTNATQLNAPVPPTNSPINPSAIGRGVFFNGARVIRFDAFEGSDGVVHKINKVLLPPTGNLAQLIAADTDLSIFNKLILKATGTPNFAVSVLTALPASALTPLRTGTLTVLAPNNAAMNSGGFSEAFIDGATPAACLDIARRHVVGLRTFSSDFLNSSIRPTPLTLYTTLQTGKTVTYGVDTNGVFFTNGLTPRASVTVADVVATNGVLHKISSVIN